MKSALRVPRASLLIGLLSCLLGVLCVTVSYFVLPLYARFEALGGGTITGWELAAGNTLLCVYWA